MTTFPSQFGVDDTARSQRSRQTDSMIAQTRATTSKAAMEQRERPRLTIAELNASSLDDLRDRFLRARRDDRGPVQVVLDAVDLPRNVVANLIAPSAAARKASIGERGALGLPRVTGADILEEMGVENRVVRGIAGFGLDLATDVTTYLGPAGWGAKLAGTGGRSVAIRGAGRKAIKRSADDLARGAAARDPDIGAYLASKGFTAEAIAARRAAGEPVGKIRSDIDKAVRGGIASGPVGTAVSLLGGDTAFRAAPLVDDVFSVANSTTDAGRAAGMDAAKRFVQKYGKGTEPGLKFGGGGSQVAHIPFTDIGIQVPAISRDARAGQRAQRAARATGIIPDAEGAMGPTLASAVAAKNAVVQDAAEWARASEEYVAAKESLERRHADAVAAGDPMQSQIQFELRGLEEAHRARLEARQGTQAQLRQQLDAAIRGVAEGEAYGGKIDAGEIGELVRLADQFKAESMREASLGMQAGETLRAVRGIREELTKETETVGRTLQRIIDAQTELPPGEASAGRYLLGSETGEVLLHADPQLQARVFSAAEPILDEMDEVRAELREAMSLGRTPDEAPVLFGSAATPDTQITMDAATVRLSDLRRRLGEVTAPLRENATQTSEEFAAAVETRFLNRLPEMQRRLWDLGTRDEAGLEAIADSYRDSIDAAARLAQTVRGQIRPALKSDEADLVELAKLGLQTADDIQATAGIIGPINAAEKVWGEQSYAAKWLHATDRHLQRTFGGPRTYARSILAQVQASYGERSRVIKAEAAKGITRELVQVAEEAGLKGVPFETVNELGLLYLYQIQNPGATLRMKNLDGTPTAMGRRAEELFATVRGSPVLEKIKAVAQKQAAVLEEIKRLEMEAGILRTPRAGYVHLASTQQARKAIGGARNIPSHQPSLARGGGGKLGQLDPFQQTRTTDITEFIDPATGKPAKFYEFDRAVLEATEDGLASLPPETANQIREMQGVIRRYDAMPDKPPQRSADPWEINELAGNRDRFGALLAGQPVEAFFETGLAEVVAQRLALHERALGRQNLIKLVDANSLMVPALEFQTAAANREFTLAGVGRGAFIETRDAKGNPVKVLSINGLRYRPISSDVASQLDNPMVQALGQGAGLMAPAGPRSSASLNQLRLVPEMLAERIEDIARGLDERARDGILAPALNLAERFTRVWKTVTLMSPAWTTINMVGDLWLGLTGGANAATMARLAGDGTMKSLLKVLWAGDNESMLEGLGTLTIAGQQMTARELSDVLRAHRITGTNIGMETALQLMDGRELRFRSQAPIYADAVAGGGRPRPIQAARNIPSDWHDLMVRYGEATGASKARAGAVATGAMLSDRSARWVAGPWMRLNARASEAMRAWVFLSYLEDGNDVASAAQKTIRSMFDYSDLTSIESRVFRTLMPFYCVPDDSEILTKEGWKHRADLRVGELVMTYNQDRDELEWKPCLEVAAFEYDQDLMTLESQRGVKFRCTPNHRWATWRFPTFVKGKHYGNTRQMVEAQDLKTSDCITMVAEFKGAESTLTPEQARLMGWLLTDGYWRFRGEHIEALIYQHPKKFLEEVTQVAGGKPRKPHPDTGVVAVPVLRDRLVPLMDHLRRGKNGCQNIPLGLSREAAEAMYDAMYKGDGNVSPHSARAGGFFAAQIPAVRECFRLLALMLGKRTQGNSDRGCYLHKCRHIKVASLVRGTEHYRGTVWCPRTENGTWVMRQGGIITITGNTWTRNNLAFQMRLMFEKPWVMGLAPKLINAVEEATAGEQRLPMNQRPRWMRESLAMMVGTDPTRRLGLLVGSAVPTPELAQPLAALTGGEGLEKALHYFGSQVNPLLSLPFQLAQGREFFSGRTIGDPETADIGRGEFLAGQIRPLAEFGPGGRFWQAADRGAGQAVGRAFLGGRVQAADDERLRTSLLADFKREEEGIRRVIRRAERDGDSDRSLAARARLMQLYQDMMQRGFEGDVPRWAVGQVETIGSAAT